MIYWDLSRNNLTNTVRWLKPTAIYLQH